MNWFIVIDNTFTYLHPENEGYPRKLLSKAFKSLKRGGRIVLDFFNYQKRKPEQELKQWIKFEDGDPFKYGLYLHYVKNGVNRSESIFIRRNGDESRKVEYSKVYSLKEVTLLLNSAGFILDGVYSDFNNSPFSDYESERLVIVGKKDV